MDGCAHVAQGSAVVPLLHFAKLVAVAALFTGTVGAVLPRDLADRRLFAYALAGPGFGLTWLCGFGLAAALEVTIATVWIVGAIVLSLFSLQVVLYAVGKEGRRSPTVAALAVGPLVACVALMVWRP
jgi:hypothetical protein